MDKIMKLKLENFRTDSYDVIFIALGGKINQLVEASHVLKDYYKDHHERIFDTEEKIKKLEELAKCAENSLAINSKTIDSLLLQVSQQQEELDDMRKIVFPGIPEEVKGLNSSDIEYAMNKVSENTISYHEIANKECKDCKRKQEKIDKLHQIFIDNM